MSFFASESEQTITLTTSSNKMFSCKGGSLIGQIVHTNPEKPKLSKREEKSIEIPQVQVLHNDLLSNNDNTASTLVPQSVDPLEEDHTPKDILDVYLAYINYNAKEYITPATIILFRLLYLIDENTNNRECLSYAKDAIMLIKLILTSGDIVRYAMLKSGNLLPYLQRMQKNMLQDGKKVDLQACCAEFFSEIGVCMSSSQEDDLLNFKREIIEYGFLPKPEIESIPWKAGEELVKEIHKHGLQGSVLKFLDTLYISLDKVLEPCLSKLQKSEKAGGRAFLFTFLRKKHELLSFKSPSEYKSKQYAFQKFAHQTQVQAAKRSDLSPHQKYLKRMISQEE